MKRPIERALLPLKPFSHQNSRQMKGPQQAGQTPGPALRALALSGEGGCYVPPSPSIEPCLQPLHHGALEQGARRELQGFTPKSIKANKFRLFMLYSWGFNGHFFPFQWVFSRRRWGMDLLARHPLKKNLPLDAFYLSTQILTQPFPQIQKL